MFAEQWQKQAMKCNRCKGRLVCVACAGRKGGAARVAKGFAKTGGARAAALRRWAKTYWQTVEEVVCPGVYSVTRLSRDGHPMELPRYRSDAGMDADQVAEVVRLWRADYAEARSSALRLAKAETLRRWARQRAADVRRPDADGLPGRMRRVE